MAQICESVLLNKGIIKLVIYGYIIMKTRND